MKNPWLSVITVVYNAESLIEHTITSVISQSCKDFEYIIVDGGSTDRTLDIVERYAPYVSSVISGPDQGIYDAMNKGIAAANGKWVIFLNAGDKLLPDALAGCFQYFSSASDIIYGNILVESRGSVSSLSPWPLNQVRYRMPFCHQAAFVKRKLLLERKFNIKYRLASDFDFFRASFIQRFKFQYININIAEYDLHGASVKNYRKYLYESFLIIMSSGDHLTKCCDLLGLLKINYRFIIKSFLMGIGFAKLFKEKANV